MSSQESSHRDAPAQATPSPSPGDPDRADQAERALRAVALRCDELQAQVTSLAVSSAIRADIIEEQVARIGDLERHLVAVDGLVADLQRQLGQGGGSPAPPGAVSLRRRAYWSLRRRAGGAVRRLLR